MNARSQAYAREAQEIDASQQRAIVAAEKRDRKAGALEILASRYDLTAAEMKSTLVRTVFAECKTDSQFMALVVVANAYKLNPLTKEIYAFPVKGGGIVPMVSVDGWIRIMNENPNFDGIEFIYHPDDKGGIEAIESVIYHKGRNHPIKVIEFLDECKRNTEPWNKSPRRMLRHRALIQGARVAFGFSGIYAEGDVIEGEYRDVSNAPISLPAHDPDTGEVVDNEPTRNERGMTEVSEEEARALDAGEDPNDGTLSDDNPTAEEGPAQEQRGEPEDRAEAAAQTLKDIDGPLEAEEPTMAEKAIKAAVDGARGATSLAQLKKIETTWLNARAAVDEDQAKGVDSLIDAARRELRAKADKAGGD